VRLTAALPPDDERYRRELFGETPLEDVVRAVVPAEECFFFAASAGIVLGLRLEDGSRVAFKALRPRPGLREACALQAELQALGFPCPRPLLGPVRLDGGAFAVVQEWIEAPQRDVHEPRARRTAAALLAELVRLAPRGEGLPAAFFGDRKPFPPPHDSRFDFRRPDGAWIDDAGRRALRAYPPDAVPRVVGHTDWSAKHFGWEDDRIRVVYDWPDSLALDGEERIVGQASVTFPATWDLPVAPKLATAEESDAFLAEYEEAAGRRLERGWVETARLYMIAYIARCEVSDLGGAQGEVQERLRTALSVGPAT
jgi:hypothetical protein